LIGGRRFDSARTLRYRSGGRNTEQGPNMPLQSPPYYRPHREIVILLEALQLERTEAGRQ
jgi:hypothetical protein